MVVQHTPPMAEQVFSVLLERIRDGYYTPGERMPSEYELASELGVSRSTIRTALARLEAAALIIRKHGEGTFVNKRASSETKLAGATWEFTRLIQGIGAACKIKPINFTERTASIEEAATLEIEPGENIIVTVRLFLADDEPVIHSICKYPASLFKVELADIDIAMKLHDFLKHYCDETIAYSSAEITAGIAADTIQELMGLEPYTAMLCVNDVFFSIDERPIALANSLLNPRLISLHITRPWYYL